MTANTGSHMTNRLFPEDQPNPLVVSKKEEVCDKCYMVKPKNGECGNCES